jgi:type IV secretory pathway TraG/TraD family ATPase VirD4
MKLRPKAEKTPVLRLEELGEMDWLKPPIPSPVRDPLAELLEEMERNDAQRKLEESPPLATAEWGSPRLLKPSEKAKGLFYLGNEEPDDDECLGLCNEQHVMAVGGTRGGKGSSVIIPNLLLWQGSVMAIDPKGENATVTARRRGTGSAFCKGMGQRVFILDPYGVAGRDDDPMEDLQAQFNPLKGLDPSDPHVIDLVNEIASSMIIVSSDSEARYWMEAARSLLKATILHVISSPDFEEHERNLVTVYRLLCQGDREKREFLQELGADEIPDSHFILFKAMEENSAFDGIIASTGETYGKLIRTAEKQYHGVMETLKSNLEFMDSPGVQECLLDSSFSLDELKEDPNGITVYLCLPLKQLETHFRWLRTIIIQALNTFERQRYRPKSGWPVLMVLDEFAALKRMPVMQNAIAQMAGHGVKFLLAFQDFNQLASVYDKAWETFVANCGVKLFLGNDDNFTREYVSKQVGEAEIRVKSINASRNTNTSRMSGSNSSTAIGKTVTVSESEGFNNGGGSTTGPGLFAFSNNRNWSRSKSYTTTEGESETATIGRSNSTTNGSGETYGFQINIQTRPLVRPDEVGRFFAHKPDPGGLPYAGQTLVLISGEQPISIRRTLYFRHRRFEGLFDPHRDFGIMPAYRRLPPPPPVIPLPHDPLPPPPKPRPKPIPPSPPTVWERFLERLEEIGALLIMIFWNWWAVFFFWLPLGFVTPIFILFWAVGMTQDFFVLILAVLLNLFPFLLGA